MSQTPPPIPLPPAGTPTKRSKTVGIIVVVIITVVFLSVAALTVSIFLPSLSEAKEQAKRVVCAANLKGISLGILRYTIENEDVYPPDIESIINDYMDGDTMLLKCPSAESNRNCDYFYFAPAARTTQIPDPSVSIIACDFRDNHGGKGRNVLYADGHVRWMSEEEFQVKLQQPYNAAFAKALRKAEGQ